MTKLELTINVICTDLPGSEFQAESCIYRDIHLGIQRGEEVIEAVPANCKRAEFTPTFRVAPMPGGQTNFLGPFAKGTPNERFFYLSWGTKNEDGSLTMFRRAKIHLSHLPWQQVEEAIRSGKPLTVTLSMTDQRGGPRCASLKGDGVRWETKD